MYNVVIYIYFYIYIYIQTLFMSINKWHYLAADVTDVTAIASMYLPP